METSIPTKQKDILNTQNSTEENNTNNSNSPLIERVQIPNTPFWIIGNKEHGYNLIMGKWKMTPEELETKEKVQQWIEENQWNLTLSTIICATQDLIKQNKTEELNK